MNLLSGVNFPLLQVRVQLYSAGSRFSFTTSACPQTRHAHARTHTHTEEVMLLTLQSRLFQEHSYMQDR